MTANLKPWQISSNTLNRLVIDQFPLRNPAQIHNLRCADFQDISIDTNVQDSETKCFVMELISDHSLALLPPPPGKPSVPGK